MTENRRKIEKSKHSQNNNNMAKNHENHENHITIEIFFNSPHSAANTFGLASTIDAHTKPKHTFIHTFHTKHFFFLFFRMFVFLLLATSFHRLFRRYLFLLIPFILFSFRLLFGLGPALRFHNGNKCAIRE